MRSSNCVIIAGGENSFTLSPAAYSVASTVMVNLLWVSDSGKARPADIRTIGKVVHQLIRSRKLLEHSRIAHARLEGGRSNRRSHIDKKHSNKKRGEIFPTESIQKGKGEKGEDK